MRLLKVITAVGRLLLLSLCDTTEALVGTAFSFYTDRQSIVYIIFKTHELRLKYFLRLHFLNP